MIVERVGESEVERQWQWSDNALSESEWECPGSDVRVEWKCHKTVR